MSSIYEDPYHWVYCPDPVDWEPDNELEHDGEEGDDFYINERDMLEGSYAGVLIARYPEEFGQRIQRLSNGGWYRRRLSRE